MSELLRRAATAEELIAMRAVSPIYANIYELGQRGHLGTGGSIYYDGVNFWFPGSMGVNPMPAWIQTGRQAGTLVLLTHPNLQEAVERFNRRAKAI